MTGSSEQLALSLERHRNHYLFSDYYLDNLLPKRLDWQKASSEAQAVLKRLQETYATLTPTENEAQTEQDWIRPVLEALGHVFEVQPSIATPDGTRRPDYVFFPDVEARDAAKPLQGKDGYAATALAVGDAKYWQRSLDQTLQTAGKPHDPFTNKNPSWQIYFYMLHTGRGWGILTNGRAWRLYHKDSAHKLNYYYEVDLPALLQSGELEPFNYFYLFFRQAAFIPNGAGRTWLDTILHASRDYAQGVGDDLKDQVYEALRHLAQGFLDYPGNQLKPDAATLKAIYDSSLILLYRLLFVLYAESRALLPLQDNETYRQSYSLDAIKKEIERSLGKPILPTSRLYWTRLQELFKAIDEGNPTLGVPAYNGDLFDAQRHPFLAKYTVGDHELRQAIDLLARTDTAEGRAFVDYRDLEVRHLGSIYEGLLEYQLRYAEQDLAVVRDRGRERYVPAAPGQRVDARAQRVYLVTDRGERKATGSYYTPDYVVKYIVQQTVQPLLDEASARWAQHKMDGEEGLVRQILSLNVLDPAMGSGHFLVEATEHIARYLVGLGLQASAGMGAEAELDYWKRRVVQACIYGVDLNPLAVELAKLSLWLVTVSRDKPLSFLDHHLRCGNSLIGARVADLGAQPVAKKPGRKLAEQEAAGQLSMFDDDAFRQKMMTAVDSMWLIESADSSTLEGVKRQERSYQEIRQELTGRYRRLADLWTARHFGVDVAPAMWPGLVAYATGRAPAQVPQYEALLKQAAAAAEEKHFFHWELEFPEVFFDRFGCSLHDRGGFDATVGNPPYSSKQSVESRRLLPLFRLVSFRCDPFAFFLERGLSIARERGYVGFIIPATWMGNSSYEALRSELLRTESLKSVVLFAGLVFKEANVDTSIVIGCKRGVPQREFTLAICQPQSLEGVAATRKTYELVEASQRLDISPTLSGGWDDVVVRLYDSSVRLCDITSHISLGLRLAALKQHSSDRRGPRFPEPLLLGHSIGRYEPPAPERFFDPSTAPIVGGTKNPEVYVTHPKILVQSIRNLTLTRRLVPTLDEAGYYFGGNVVGITLSDSETSTNYVLALLASNLLNEFFRHRFVTISLTSTFLGQVPIRRIAFTTPHRRRVHLGVAGVAQVCEWLNSAATSSAPSANFAASTLGGWLDARLPIAPDGSPDAKHEQSDVIHDLLAHLAQQMIDMHKQKQAEVRGFLDWLSGYTGLAADDWTLKSALRSYYQQDWKGMRNLLDRNSVKIKKVNVLGREASEMIETEWQKSADKLHPLLARIAATDRLIDLIVYRLYGLSQEEVALVEGATGAQ